MFSTRFQHIADEFSHFIERRWVVFNAESPHQIAAIKHLSPVIYQTFAPSVQSLIAEGYDVVQSPPLECDVAVVLLSKSKALSKHMIAMAQKCTNGGLVVVDGQKDSGIDSILKDLKKKLNLDATVSKAHGKIAWGHSEAVLKDYVDTPKLIEDGFFTCAGVFSAESIDPASQLLSSVLPELSGSVVDLGAGWGYLTRRLVQMPTNHVIAVEADHRAIEMAKHNVNSSKVEFVWGDATTWTPKFPVDTIVMNPPFHHFGKADPGIGIEFIKTAARSLVDRGECYLVANRHLPYEKTLNDLFHQVSEVTKDNRFKVLYASQAKLSKHNRA